MHTLLRFLEPPLILSLEACLVVALVWVIITLVRARRATLWDATKLSAPEALGVASIVTIVIFAVPADPGVQTTVNLVPLVGLVREFFSFDQEIALANIVGNLLLFLPIGAVVVWRFHTRVRAAVSAGVVLSILVESLQLGLNNGRSVDIDDVLVNGLGALIGAAAMSWILSTVRRREAASAPLS